MINRIKRYIELFIAKRSSDNYIKYLKKRGVTIGKGTYIQDPKHIEIAFLIAMSVF